MPGYDPAFVMRNAITPATAAEFVPDGATVMVGGFMGVGSPHRVIKALVARGVRNPTLISCPTPHALASVSGS